MNPTDADVAGRACAGQSDLPYVIRWYDGSDAPEEVSCPVCRNVLGDSDGPELLLNPDGSEKPVDLECVFLVDDEIAAAMHLFYAELNRLNEATQSGLTAAMRDGALDVAKRAAHICYEPMLGLTMHDVEMATGVLALYCDLFDRIADNR